MTSSGFLFVILVVVVILLVRSELKRRRLEREQFIRSYVFPGEVLDEAFKDLPQITPKQAHLVARALRQFFLAHAHAGDQAVLMPSKAADALWHAFIGDTKAYGAFCQRAFGQYLHYIPEGRMQSAADDAALWRTWRLACLEENINPSAATRLPLLYAIDVKVGMPGAEVYRPDGFRRLAGSSGAGTLGLDGNAGSSS